LKSFVLAACLLAACAGLASPAHPSTDPFAEFRIPDHSWSSGSASLGLAGSRFVESFATSSMRDRTLHSDLSGSLSTGWDSDALLYVFGISATGNLDAERRDQTTGGLPSYWKQQNLSQGGREDWQLTGEVRAYPWEAPVGADLSAFLYGRYQQSWSREDQLVNDAALAQRSEYRRNDASHDYETTASAQAELGVGRVRDATVVDAVHVLEQRLLETGALARPLSTAARAKLAALHYVAPDLSRAHDRPARFFWREVERILADDGALGSRGLDAYSVLRALEQLPYRPIRQRGAFAGIVISASTDHAIRRSETVTTSRDYEDGVLMGGYQQSSGRRDVLSRDTFWGGGQAEYDRPLGWRWQVDAAVQALRPARPGESGLDASSHVSLTWYVADRWEANARVEQSRYYIDPRGDEPAQRLGNWLVSYGFGLAYYLEDMTRIEAGVSESQHRHASPLYAEYFREGRFQIAITRRLWGRMEAPGLMEPMHLIN
jgi:hypothetical protein